MADSSLHPRLPNAAFVLGRFEEEERIPEQFLQPEKVDTKVKIKLCYSPEMAEAFSILRFLLDKGEWSERGMALTHLIISQVKNHYAAWAYRKSFLEAAKSPEKERAEVSLTLQMILEEPKGFQTWDHLRFVVDRLGHFEYATFIEFLAKVYQHDTKNYHAWMFRVWATDRFGFHGNEWVLMESLLRTDPTNNSIWSYRHFLAKALKVDIDSERSFVLGFVKGPGIDNESAWFYLDDIYETQGEFSEKLGSHLEGMIESGQANRFVYKSLIFNELRRPQPSRRRDCLDTWLRALQEKHDPNRKKFWIHFAQSFCS